MFRWLAFLLVLGAVNGQAQVDSTSFKDSLERKELDEVVVSGTLRPVRKMESPVNVEVYSHQFFKKNPSPSIFEALQMINGIRPQLNCNICNTGDIHINGLEGPYTMVTIDGMPIVSGLSTVYGLFGIPNEMIERVELVKGPASGLYGSEAVGGLINIITKSAKSSPRFSAELMSSSWQEKQADLAASFKHNKVHSLWGVHLYHYDHPVDHNQDGFTDLTLQKRLSMFNKWKWDRRSDRVAEMGLRYYWEDRWGGQMNWTKQFKGTDSIYGESIQTNRLEWIGKYQLPLKENIVFSWSYTRHHQHSYYGLVPFIASQQIAFGQMVWMKKIKAHQVLMGAAIRHTFFDDNTVATTDPRSGKNIPDRILLPGLFFQDEWKLNTKHTLLWGLRYDHSVQHGAIFTPRLAWKWSPEDDLVIRLNTGTGFRVVNIFTEDHAALTGAREVVINGNIKPEKSWNINLNTQKRWDLSQHAQLNLDASIWYTRFSNRILPDYDTDPNKIIYSNLNGFAVSKGMSITLDGHIHQRLKWMIGSTIQEVYQMREGIEKFIPVLTERWSGVWTISYLFSKPKLSIDYTGNLYGPMRLPLVSDLDPRNPYSPVWSIQNIQITKKWPRIETFVGIKNLLNWTPTRNIPFLIARASDPFDKRLTYDAQGQILPTPENPYALSFDPTYSYAPNQGRRLYLGFRYRLSK